MINTNYTSHIEIEVLSKYFNSFRLSGFHCFGLLNNNLFTEQGRQPWVQPKPEGPCFCTYVPQWQGGQLYPQAPGFLFVASATRRATVGVF
jgi:hypothetical protein